MSTDRNGAGTGTSTTASTANTTPPERRLARAVNGLRQKAVSVRDMLVSAGPLAVLALVLIVGAFWWLKPAPPRSVTLATGPERSAYDSFGQLYAERLRAAGIQVRLLPTEGSSENLQRLRDGDADLAFVRSGTAASAQATRAPSEDEDSEDRLPVESLGSLFIEPLWVFYREDAARRVGARNGKLDTLARLGRLHVSIGAAGSGVPLLMTRLLQANGLDAAQLKLSRLTLTPATAAMLDGKLDAMAFASAPESPIVQMLLRTPGIHLMDFVQAEAYARRLDFLTPVTLPRGVADLALDLPPEDVHLIASTTALLARDDLHPALLHLFSRAARDLHGGPGWFQRAREFPKASVGSEFTMAPEAERFLAQGPGWLYRLLPFWLANVVERMWLALGLILALLLPLSRIVPPLYTYRIRSRVFRWYAALRDIEQRALDGNTPPTTLRHELDELEQVVTRIAVPLSYTDELYALLGNIARVRERLAPVPAAQGAPA